MKHSLVVISSLLGCGASQHAAPPVPIANAKPPTKLHAVTLQEEWPAQPDADRDIVARVPAGPFPDLSAVCVALDRKESDDKFEGCNTGEDDELGGGPFVRIGEVATWEPLENGYEMPVRLVYLAVQTRAGWYVLPKLGDTGNRYSGLFFEAERASGGLLIRYNYDLSTAGRFASETEHGVIACEAVDGAVACTPKIASRKYSQRMDTSQPDWQTSTDVQLACTASYAIGAITLAPMPKPENDVDETWTPEAASWCSGTRVVTY